MQTITLSIIVERPVADVFAFVTDARNNPAWQARGGLKSIQQEPEAPVGVGTRITEMREVMGQAIEDTSEVTEYKPPHWYTRTNLKNDAPVRGDTMTFEEAPEGTRWTSSIQVQESGLLKLIEPLLVGMLKKGFEDSMAQAKAVMEQQAAGDSR